MKKLLMIGFIFLISINFVLALGVSSPYWKDNPLEMQAGQIKDVAFTLVSKEDDEITQAIVSLDENDGIAEIISGSEYTVIPGTTDTKIILKIIIPDSASIGDSYNVRFSVKSDPDDEGTVQLRLNYDVGFPIVVVGETDVQIKSPEVITTTTKDDLNKGIIIWVTIIVIEIFLIILILGMIYLVIKRRNNIENKTIDSYVKDNFK